MSDMQKTIDPKRESILLATSSLIRICQEEKIVDKIASEPLLIETTPYHCTILVNDACCDVMLHRL